MRTRERATFAKGPFPALANPDPLAAAGVSPHASSLKDGFITNSSRRAGGFFCADDCVPALRPFGPIMSGGDTGNPGEGFGGGHASAESRGGGLLDFAGREPGGTGGPDFADKMCQPANSIFSVWEARLVTLGSIGFLMSKV